jgi:hypothetical protein
MKYAEGCLNDSTAHGQAFNTNATWLAMVHSERIPKPFWLPEEEFHPADKYNRRVWTYLALIFSNH